MVDACLSFQRLASADGKSCHERSSIVGARRAIQPALKQIKKMTITFENKTSEKLVKIQHRNSHNFEGQDYFIPLLILTVRGFLKKNLWLPGKLGSK